MAKDDYDVVVFKILLYYYAIFKGTIYLMKLNLSALLNTILLQMDI